MAVLYSLTTLQKTITGHILGSHKDVRPWLLELRSSNIVIISTVTVAVFLDIFFYSVIIPVAPYALVHYMHVSENEVQHDVSIGIMVYSAGLLASSLFFGMAADMLKSRRLIMLFGLAALAGATIVLCLARSFAVFIIGRLLQGISAATVWVAGLALISDSFAEEKIGFVMGVVGGGLSMGAFLGPLLGGIIYERAGYNAVFGLCFGFLGIDICLRLFMLEKKVLRRFEKPAEDDIIEMNDIPESVTVAPTIVDTIAEEETSKHDGQTDPTDIQASDEPMPPLKKSKLPVTLRLLGNMRLVNSLFVTLMMGWIMTGLESTLPLHAEELFHFDSLGAGLLFLPIAITSMIGPLAGLWVDRNGPRWALSCGFLISTPMLALLRVPDKNTTGQKVLLFAFLTFWGLGLALMMTCTMAEISSCVMDAERKRPGIFGATGAFGQAFGLFNFVYSAGSLIGPLEAGFTADKHGWNTVTWVLALLSGISLIPAFLFTGGYVFQKKKPESESIDSTPVVDQEVAMEAHVSTATSTIDEKTIFTQRPSTVDAKL
ncbi:major facilitator superfamily domain-containing protein [Lipomyces oligophaga]|uniref:major facilitator superfamily domain-containing protein n=1 Tax=Lipomyces oligophaga TaxID=45792 RepID=UPI0034CDFD39